MQESAIQSREICTQVSAVGVVYLCRRAEGLEPAQRFVASYDRFNAGIEHQLIVVFKGYDRQELQHARYLFRRHEPVSYEVDDSATDIDCYLSVASEMDNFEYLCFLNTFSELRASEWLVKMLAGLMIPEVAIVGATGSYESLLSSNRLISKVIWLCATGRLAYHSEIYAAYRQYIDVHVRQWKTPSLALRLWRSLLKRDNALSTLAAHDHEFEEYWQTLVTPGGVYDYLVNFEPFPNPAIRTNAFMLRRADLLPFVRRPQRMSKAQSYEFESGINGLTKSLCSRDKRAIVVNSDGECFDIDKWPGSDTFRIGDQSKLLVDDNQTRGYQNSSRSQRRLLAALSWGSGRLAASVRPHTFGIDFG